MMNIGFPDCCESFWAWAKLVWAPATGRKTKLRSSEIEKTNGFMDLLPAI
tara:strand:- start:1708 stop:1857 length:150 start_codon:yes stop_codon:yes gene_type:complete